MSKKTRKMQDRSETPDAFIFTDSNAVDWRPSSFVSGVEVKNLGIVNERAMELVRFQPGTTFPSHKHNGPEFLYILEGDLTQNGQRLGPGWASIAPSGTSDDNVSTVAGCVFLIIYSKDSGTDR